MDIEDVVNEYDITTKWRSWLEKNGAWTTRLENTGAALPDLFFAIKGIVVFHEMKMLRGRAIYTSAFQWAWHIRHTNVLRPYQQNYVVYNLGVFEGYSINQMKKAPQESAGYGKIKITIDELIPNWFATNEYECYEYLESVMDQAFPARVKRRLANETPKENV